MARVDLFLWLKHYRFSSDSYFYFPAHQRQEYFSLLDAEATSCLIIHSLIKDDVAFACLVLIYWKYFMVMVPYLVLSLSVFEEKQR